MIWVAWRIQRTQYLVVAGVVALVAIWLATTGLAPYSDWAVTTNHGFEVVLYVLPGVLGLALGASVIAEEIDHGTSRLAWTQSISRSRWLRCKLAVGALVCCASLALLMPLIGWWSRTGFERTETGIFMLPKVFAINGTVNAGYALFAFALGVTLGAIIHRSGWAFITGVPIIVVVRLAVESLRATLIAPETLIDPSINPGWQPNGYLLNYAYLPVGHLSPAAGQTWESTWSSTGPYKLMNSCIANAPGSGLGRYERFAHCAATAHLQQVMQYLPESHFWVLQAAETALLVALAVGLLATTAVAIRRRSIE
jgi:ABC-type transport system involved in multi-copper enzyme maturation permease subunit